MKKVYGLFIALAFSAAAMAQATPHEKKEIKKDLIKERDKKGDVAGDVIRGDFKKAKRDNKAAVVHHKRAVKKAEKVRRRDAERLKNG